MTTEHSTYTYEHGEQETVTLKRGPATPHGHALLKITYHDGEVADTYVNTAWLRDRLNGLGEPCPVPAAPRALTPDAITNEMVERAHDYWGRNSIISRDGMRGLLTAALTEPPKRPEGAEDIEALIREAEKVGQGADDEALANYLAARLNVSPKENR